LESQSSELVSTTQKYREHRELGKHGSATEQSKLTTYEIEYIIKILQQIDILFGSNNHQQYQDATL
jgi:hypothetical protein